MSYAIRTNCIITFKKNFFSGTWRKPKFTHSAKVHAIVKKHSYGQLKGQHTFTLQVIDCDTSDYEKGDRILIKGRNLYPNLLEHLQGEESKEQSR